LKGKIVKYISRRDGTIKMWILPVKDIETKANKGLLASGGTETTLNEYDEPVLREIKTGIDDESDLSHIDYIDSLFYAVNDENYAENKKIEVLSCAMKIPCDFPRRKDMKLAVIAGDAFTRGNNFNNPTTYLAPTLLALNGVTDDVQRGAINTQKGGRICGNTLKCYEKMEVFPKILCEKDVLNDILSNIETVKDIQQKIKEFNEKHAFKKAVPVIIKDVVKEKRWRNIKKRKDEDISEKCEEAEESETESVFEDAEEEVPEATPEPEVEEEFDARFIENLKNVYNNGNIYARMVLNILKEEDDKISVNDLFAKMRDIGYDKEVSSLIALLTLSYGNNMYAKYWILRKSIVEGDFVHMPIDIKRLLA
jgi:hypothetical protein